MSPTAPFVTIIRRTLAGLSLVLLALGPVRAAEFSAAQKTEIESIIRSYLVQNPEVLTEAMHELEKRQADAESAAQTKMVGELSGQLFGSANQTVIGNPNGKVTLVEFFDYNCAYCKRALDDLARLMKDNPDLRVVLKDLPILSPGSVEAAQIAIAARNQLKGDKFWDFHQKLLGMHGPVGKAQALSVAKDMGVDMDKLARDAAAPEVKAGIETNDETAKALLMNGTPSYVLGQDVVVGAVGYDELKAKLDNVRKCGKAACG